MYVYSLVEFFTNYTRNNEVVNTNAAPVVNSTCSSCNESCGLTMKYAYTYLIIPYLLDNILKKYNMVKKVMFKCNVFNYVYLDS